MVVLYKDPQGERIFQRSMSQAGTILGATNVENDKSRYLELEEHCKDLEGRLAKSGQVKSSAKCLLKATYYYYYYLSCKGGSYV